jgi:hypothetical protein
MARRAALHFHYRMFIYERSRSLDMALRANCILSCSVPKLFSLERSVRIVAVGTLHQPLVNLVVEGHGELRLNIGVALEAKLWLGHFEQVLRLLTRVNAVTAHATNLGLPMFRALKVWMGTLMATQASCIDLPGCSRRRIEDFSLVPTRLYVSLPWTMAAFTGNTFSAMLQCKFRMGV